MAVKKKKQIKKVDDAPVVDAEKRDAILKVLTWSSWLVHQGYGVSAMRQHKQAVVELEKLFGIQGFHNLTDKSLPLPEMI